MPIQSNPLMKHVARRGIARYVDVGLGMTLMRDPRVPVRSKAMAVGLSAAIMAGLIAAEIPLEAMLALLVPILGPAVDLAIDGAEEALGTLFLSTLVIQKLAPKDVVEAIRLERG
ncbi:MAG: hypothetical protein JWM80_5377 [Cyanobacteria bacterium RYN_339]|nr:hypothetical protein [Cyanobacteria bacterium RYN_339]